MGVPGQPPWRPHTLATPAVGVGQTGWGAQGVSGAVSAGGNDMSSDSQKELPPPGLLGSEVQPPCHPSLDAHLGAAGLATCTMA